MQVLIYSSEEAAASLWRRREAAALAVITIAVAMFVLGALLLLTRNATELMRRWEDAAEMSVFLQNDADASAVSALGETLKGSELVTSVSYLTKTQALERFREDFAELAGVANSLGESPFPASFEIRLRPAVRESTALDDLAAKLAKMSGVAEVRYDRRWLERLAGALALIRGIGIVIVVIFTIGAALTVVNVVRLACYARRGEIEIMQLVGAPLAYVRGPFVMEGVMQGGMGALVALAVLWAGLTYLRAEYGPDAARVLGIAQVRFLSLLVCAGLVLSGMAVGCVGGAIGARTVHPMEDR